MKIAFFTDTYFPQLNGVTISVSNFADQLRKKGHTVYIYAPKLKGYIDKEPNIYRLPSVKVLNAEPNVHAPIGISPKGLFQLFKMDFDIIHAHGNGFFSLLGYEVARAQGIPFIMTFHTLHNEYTHYFFKGKIIKPGVVKRLLRFMANRCDGVIVPSEKMKQKLSEFGYKKEIIIIPNFVDSQKFEVEDTNYLHEKLNISFSEPILLTVGRIGKEKNFDFLLRAFAKLSKKEKKSHLVIVGQGHEKENLENLAVKLGVSDRVHFTGRIDSKLMPEIYKDSDIFVFASTTEVHPLVVLEAAAAGLPLVVSDDLAYKNVVENNKNGFVLPLDAKLFAQNLRKILSDKELRQKFGNTSKEIINKNFSEDLVVDKLIRFYNEKIGKKKLRAKIFKKTHSIFSKVIFSRF